MSLYPIVDAQSASPRRYPPQRVRRERGLAARRRYPGDLTDAQWALIAPLVTPPVGGRRGRPPAHPMRAIVAAILYVTCTGCPWRALPREFPPPGTVYWWFARWRDDHTLMRLHDRLREQCRTAAGRHRHPTAGAIDSQSVRAADTVPRRSRGFDVAKKVNGLTPHRRGHHGPAMAVMVTGAHVNDRSIARDLLWRTRLFHPGLRLIWADGGYIGTLSTWARHALDLTVHLVRKLPGQHTFVVLPRRWVVERTFAWISKKRRCVRDYEHLPASHAAFVTWAMIHVMVTRLARHAKPAQATST
ncbi:IS5 family transposase [Micromonospora sp. BRA006-A]|nr:IS5 family transposase [Micromonospora sp. BRA006-A]